MGHVDILYHMPNKYIPFMLDLVREGGEIALAMLEDSSPTLKPDFSVLTKADLAVSSMMHKKLESFLAQPGHLLIDEEDPQSSRHFDREKLARNPYLWVIDPIDGTRAFANRMPLFGVSIGLLKDLRPWLGAVYFPGLQELFYADGTAAYFVKKAFSNQEVRARILPVDQPITRQSVFFGNDCFFKEHDWNFSFCQMMLPACAVLDFCWPSLGRGCGCMFDSYIWDFGGAWPIARAAGLDIRSVKTGEVIDRASLDIFQGTGPLTWRLKENCLLSSAGNFPRIVREGMKKKVAVRTEGER